MKFVLMNKKFFLLSIALLFFNYLCNAQNWDIDLLKEINLHRNHSLDHLFRIITDYAHPLLIVFLYFYGCYQLSKRIEHLKQNQHLL